MPPGTPYDAFALPYRIRVDDFTTSSNTPALHLLTHTHSDHITGLSAKSFGSIVVCSHDAKQMLLHHEVFAERELREAELRAERVRTYAHLKLDGPQSGQATLYYQGSRDLLKALPLYTPKTFELYNGENVIITLLDANHCPGAVMYLIEGSRGAVLHTGDFRAEPWFLDSLSRNPIVQPYLYSSTKGGLNKSLECIYLDTACVFSNIDVPTKQQAITNLIELMRLYPPSVYFYINAWTWGYEDILKAIASAFQCKIHVDRYKANIYTHLSDPYLRLIITRDAATTRFHACERFHRCDHVSVDAQFEELGYENLRSKMGKRVIYVNPVSMGKENWDLYVEDTKVKLGMGVIVSNLLVPLSRHSPLPELKAFVSLLRPKRIVPNTLDPKMRGFDWLAIERMFSDCVQVPVHGALSNTPSTPWDSGRRRPDTFDDATLRHITVHGNEDVQMKNVMGAQAVEVATRWADRENLVKKFRLARKYLGTKDGDMIDGLLGLNSYALEPSFTSNIDITNSHMVPSPTLANEGSYGGGRVTSDEDTDEGESDVDTDARGRTAHRLFASLAGIDERETVWWVSSPTSSSGVEDQELKTRNDTTVSPGRLVTPSKIMAVCPLTPPVSSAAFPQRAHVEIVKVQQGNHLNEQLTGGLASPIRLQPSPSHTLISPPVSRIWKGKGLRTPKKHIKRTPMSPLVERKIRMNKKKTVDARISGTHANQLANGRGKDDQNVNSNQMLTQSAMDMAMDRREPVGSSQVCLQTVSLSSESQSRSRQIKFYQQRIRIGEQLARSRPSETAPSYVSKHTRLANRYAKLEAQQQYTSTLAKVGENGDDPRNHAEIKNDDGGMDWERSRILADKIREAINSGGTVSIASVLPPLKCADSQDN